MLTSARCWMPVTCEAARGPGQRPACGSRGDAGATAASRRECQLSPSSWSTTSASSVTRCSSAPLRRYGMGTPSCADGNWTTPARLTGSGSMSPGLSSAWLDAVSPMSGSPHIDSDEHSPQRWSKARQRAVQSWLEQRQGRSPGAAECTKTCPRSQCGRSPHGVIQDIPGIFARLARDEEQMSRLAAPWLFVNGSPLRTNQLRQDLWTPSPRGRHQHDSRGQCAL